MDRTPNMLVLMSLPFIIFGFVNYRAVSMADGQRSALTALGVFFGASGILLMAAVIFWPLISLIFYFAAGAANVVALFNPLLIGAAPCMLGSATTLAANACMAGRGP
jgi:hypothetical protein